MIFDEPDLDDWDEADAELTQAADVFCPYCGEHVDIGVDQGGGGIQEYVEDCPVCCQSWSVRVTFDMDGQPSVFVTTLDDE